MHSLAGLGLVAFHASTLRRALLNLVQNAADAMPQGGTVLLAGQGTATQVQLRVQDTGSGIPAEHLGQIFEPLYTTKPGGTGLGLYIAGNCRGARGPDHGRECGGVGHDVYMTCCRARSCEVIAGLKWRAPSYMHQRRSQAL
jgi:light-regulated signal transduction histidine kinase (bacteriophytochrome)